MNALKSTKKISIPVSLKLPLALLDSYLFFLTRRPISRSNPHYLADRIKALQSLKKLLIDIECPVLNNIVTKLSHLNQANFHRIAPSLHTEMTKALEDNESKINSHIYSHSQPGNLPDKGQYLLIFAPAIGIGDEIISFRLPKWLKNGSKDRHITIMSAYKNIWDDVQGVDEIIYYDDYPKIINAMRGDSAAGTYDVVMLIDFEKPNLYKTICNDRAIDIYIEISISNRSAVVVDNKNNRMNVSADTGPYYTNYYYAICHLLDWLGIEQDDPQTFSGTVSRTDYPVENEFHLFVSPFTSKYDPSQAFWSKLLVSLQLHKLPVPVKVMLDTGANHTTEQFAIDLKKSIVARTMGVIKVELCRTDEKNTLSLCDVFKQIQKSDLLLCADSFTAHASALFGQATFVVAAKNLTNWRVPSESIFYFGESDSIECLADGMRTIISAMSMRKDNPVVDSDLFNKSYDVTSATEKLKLALNNECELKYIEEKYNVFYHKLAELLLLLEADNPNLHPVSLDYDYTDLININEVPLFKQDDHEADIEYIKDVLQSWSNTNYCKYVSLIVKNKINEQELQNIQALS